MKKQTPMGMNRTGIQMSPKQTQKMLEEADGAVFTPGDESGMIQVRTAYIRDAAPVGSVPPPGTAKGAVKAGVKALTGKKAHVLIDRLGERLAFERTGTRLYEAMMTKCRAAANGGGEEMLRDLEHYCQEEAEHFHMLVGCLEKLGADPTVQTPAADVAGVESMGIMQVVTDPMTSVTQSLHAILAAELVDNDCWDELIKLSQQFGQDEMTQKFEQAREAEREHLDGIRRLYEQCTLAEARVGGEV